MHEGGARPLRLEFFGGARVFRDGIRVALPIRGEVPSELLALVAMAEGETAASRVAYTLWPRNIDPMGAFYNTIHRINKSFDELAGGRLMPMIKDTISTIGFDRKVVSVDLDDYRQLMKTILWSGVSETEKVEAAKLLATLVKGRVLAGGYRSPELAAGDRSYGYRAAETLRMMVERCKARQDESLIQDMLYMEYEAERIEAEYDIKEPPDLSRFGEYTKGGEKAVRDGENARLAADIMRRSKGVRNRHAKPQKER